MTFSSDFVRKTTEVLNELDTAATERAALLLSDVRKTGGRLFVLGSGGGAGHASHATCDFRKLCDIEAYAPYDNVSELTARVNDEGWDTTLVNWLKVSRFNSRDCLMVFSVGGGNKEKNISGNLVKAVEYAQEIGASVIGIVGKDGGATAKAATVAILIPEVDASLVTPLTESIQSVIWHLLAFHPALQTNKGKWESEAKVEAHPIER